MKNFLNNRLFSFISYILIIVVITKGIWFVVSLFFLPVNGVEHNKEVKLKNLYYRAKLATKSKKPPPPPPIVQKIVKPVPVVITMNYIKLLALYNSKDIIVVTVKKGNKTKILSKGENIDGFVLTSAGADYAIFTKNKKEFKIILGGDKIKNPSSIKVAKPTPVKSVPKKNQKKPKKEGIIKVEGEEERIITKSLLTSYTKDIDKVWKDIGIGEHKKNGVLDGFKVNFVKRGSDFEKLGLKRGDILKSINGQELNSYNAAFSFYKEIGDIDSLTLSITRNNQDMELEYEIH
jgi:general secretion pathway protein C